MHVAAVAALLQFEGIRKPLMDSLPIMVELIKPPEMKQPPPEVVPPKPRPVARDQPPVAKAPPSEAPPRAGCRIAGTRAGRRGSCTQTR